MALDFRLARVDPNFATSIQESFEAGRERGRLRARDAALVNYNTDPEGTADAVMGIDPGLGIQLAQVNRQNAAQAYTQRRQQQEDERAALEHGNVVLARVIDDTLRLPEAQRRQHLVAVAQGMAGFVQPAEAQRLLSVAQSVDVSDNGLRGVRAGLAPTDDRPIITQFGIVLPPGARPPASAAPTAAAPALAPGSMGTGAGVGTATQDTLGRPTPPPPDAPTLPADALGMDERARDMLARLLIGEAPNQGAAQQAVANVVINRARLSGRPVTDEITAPHQFEPYGNRARWQELSAIPTTDPRYQAALRAIDTALSNDATGGATHFYSPAVMAGRGGPPEWARGVEGQDIGGNTFLRLPYAGRQPTAQAPAEQPAAQTATEEVDLGGGYVLRPMETPAQRQAAQNAAEAQRHNQTVERQADERIALDRSRPPQHEAPETWRPVRPSDHAPQGVVQISSRGEYRYAPERATRQTNMPANVANREDADVQRLSTASDMVQRLRAHGERIRTGEMVFSPTANARANPLVQGVLGSTENTRNIADFRADVESLTNAILQMNVGPQTDSDARRARDEIFNNLSDSQAVQRGLRRMQGIQARAQQLLLDQINRRRARYGDPPATMADLTGDLPEVYGAGARPSAAPRAAAAPAQRPPAGRPAAATPRGSGGALPPAAARALQEGHNTTFGNGQVWTLRGGRPVRVR